jgi:prolipoprotein diacylglyceryltransferase
MRRILLQWRGIRVWSYPALLYLGLVAGVAAGNVAARAAGIDTFRAFVATHILIVPALAGARLLHVAANWSVYRGDLRRIWDRNDGGAAMYGGLFCAFVISVPLVPALGLPFGTFWDVTSFTILVGMIFTRIGCLLNGCCAGRPSRGWLAIRLPDHLGVWERRVPTQLLEAGWAAILLVAALAIWRSLSVPGTLFALVTAAYAAGRLPLETARVPETGAGRFTMYHAISAAMVIVSLVVLLAR